MDDRTVGVPPGGNGEWAYFEKPSGLNPACL